jgi:hypothetical protein
METDTFLPIAAGKFCLLSYWLVAGIWAFPSGFPIPFKNFPGAGQEPLGIYQRLYYILLSVPSSCSTAFKSIFQLIWLKRGNFHLFSLKSWVSVDIFF